MISRAIVSLLVVLALPASASAASTRYASPTGTGECTTASAACSIGTAIGSAGAGDTVILAAGTYNASGAGTVYMDPAAITVRGAVTGSGRPVVNGGLSLDNAGSSVQDVEFDLSAAPGDNAIELVNGASGDRVVARLTGGSTACRVDQAAKLTNALCIGMGTNDIGASLENSGAGRTTARNVTAQGGFYGLYAGGNDPSDFLAGIAIGTTTDIRSAAGLTLRDVAWDTSTGDPAAANQEQITVPGSAPAPFRSTTDFRQATGAATINAGNLEDELVGATELDLNGNLRKLGTHVDAGAYEDVPTAAVVVAGAQTTSTADGATFAGTINAAGGATQWHVEYGPTNTYGTSTPTQFFTGSPSAVPVSIPVSGLGDAPTHYRLVATTDAGTSSSTDEIAYRAPTLTAGAPTDVTDTTATLNGSVALKGSPSNKVEFVYGSATSAPQTITADGAISQALTGLTPRTTYQWKLRVTRDNEVFETPLGTFTTAATSTTGPSGTPSPEPSATPSPTPTKPTFSVGGSTAAAQKAGQNLLLKGKGLAVKSRCGVKACSLKVTGYVTIGKKRYGTLASPKALKLGAGESGQVTLTANKRLRKRVAKYLKRHPKAKAVIHLKAVFTDADGAKTTKKLTIKVRRLKK